MFAWTWCRTPTLFEYDTTKTQFIDSTKYPRLTSLSHAYFTNSGYDTDRPYSIAIVKWSTEHALNKAYNLAGAIESSKIMSRSIVTVDAECHKKRVRPYDAVTINLTAGFRYNTKHHAWCLNDHWLLQSDAAQLIPCSSVLGLVSCHCATARHPRIYASRQTHCQ